MIASEIHLICVKVIAKRYTVQKNKNLSFYTGLFTCRIEKENNLPTTHGLMMTINRPKIITLEA